ncbi:sensor histidine kinase [Streptosporangium sp. NPDC002721]|uniref:sensor histidine kinase n=1 Tax=Streptosporangium sp. NPDC002721 TaxID=3366188 RepID=UPI0036A6F0EB
MLRSILVDVLLAVAFTGLTMVTLNEQHGGQIPWAEGVVAVLTVVPIAMRQRAPVLTMAVIVGALTAYALLGYGDFPNGGVGILVGMFTVAMLRPPGVAAVMFLATIATTMIAYFTGDAPAGAAAWSQVVQVGLIMAGVWALGDSTKNWALRAERLAAQAARAAADERVSIARELHDIVSHHMSVVSLQSGLAEYVLDSDPGTARTAIVTAGEASREALLDMRRLLDVLRIEPGDELDVAADTESVSGSGYRPQPGLAQLEELVNRTRNAGVEVDLSVTGRRLPLPPGLDLCAYRVVQESLTNILKHAGPACARVEVDYGPHTLMVRISDDGNGGNRVHASPASHGIRGMRERAELYGGMFSAGPAKEGGFTVTLRLPLDAAR